MRQPQLSAQLLGTAIDLIHATVAVYSHKLPAKRLKQTPQRGITFKGHAVDFQQLLCRNARLDHITRRQTLTHGQHHRIGQRCLIGRLRTALLLLIAQPHPPFGLPLAALFSGMHRQQRIGTVPLGRFTQRRRVGAFNIVDRANQLFAQVRQRQAQWQPPVLRCTAQRFGRRLPVTDQA